MSIVCNKRASSQLTIGYKKACFRGCYSKPLVPLLGMLAILLLGLLVGNTIASETVYLEKSGENESDESLIVLNVPAVSGNDGKLIKFIIKETHTPGVLFTGGVDVGEDTSSSAWVAYFVSSMLAGKSPLEDGIEITIVTDSDNVEGPSASLAVSVATFLLKSGVLESGLVSSYSITGAVSLDGSSVVVGGTLEKLKATIDAGLHKMIVPAANLFILNNTDVSDRTVVPVYGILDAVDKVFNRSRSVFTVEYNYPEALERFLDMIAEDFARKAQELGTKLSEESLERIMYYINESIRETERGNHYTGASLAYTAYLYAVSSVMQDYGVDKLEIVKNELEKKLEQIREQLSIYEDKLAQKGYIGQYELELLAISESRAWMCEALLSEYENTLLDQDMRKNSLIQARARCETALTWLRALDIEWGSQPMVRADTLEKVIDHYQVFLDQALAYAESAVEMEGIPPQIRVYFNELKDLAEKVREASKKGSPGLRLGLSVELASRISSFLTQMNLVEPAQLEGYVAELWRNLAVLEGHLALMGRHSIMASLYSEYAGYRGHDDITRLALLGTAVSSIHPLLLYTFLEQDGGRSPLSEEVYENALIRLKIADYYLSWVIMGAFATMVSIIVLAFYRREI